MSREVRIGIIGLGTGKENAKAFHRNKRGCVTALCDLNQELMVSFSKELSATERFKHFTDYKALCRSKEIDAVFIGTPNQFHAQMAIEAIRNGKHVMITKPLADSLNAARGFVEAIESERLVGMMSLEFRFSPECQYLLRQAETGIFGDVYYGRASSF